MGEIVQRSSFVKLVHTTFSQAQSSIKKQNEIMEPDHKNDHILYVDNILLLRRVWLYQKQVTHHHLIKLPIIQFIGNKPLQRTHLQLREWKLNL